MRPLPYCWRVTYGRVAAAIVGLVGLVGLVALSASLAAVETTRSAEAHLGATMSRRALESDARGIATCASLGLSIPPAWASPTRGSPHISALARSGVSRKSVTLIEQYSPAACGSAEYVTTDHARTTLVVQFPTQMTPHDRSALSLGEATYLRRTGAFVYVHNVQHRTSCPVVEPCP